jgi:hypothetical protein
MCELFKTESSTEWAAAPFHGYSGKRGLFFETPSAIPHNE